MDKIIVPADKLAKAVIEHLLPAARRAVEKRHAEMKEKQTLAVEKRDAEKS